MTVCHGISLYLYITMHHCIASYIIYMTVSLHIIVYRYCILCMTVSLHVYIYHWIEFILYVYNNTTVHITVSPHDCISLQSAYHSITAKCISLGTTALLSIQWSLQLMCKSLLMSFFIHGNLHYTMLQYCNLQCCSVQQIEDINHHMCLYLMYISYITYTNVHLQYCRRYKSLHVSLPISDHSQVRLLLPSLISNLPGFGTYFTKKYFA